MLEYALRTYGHTYRSAYDSNYYPDQDPEMVPTNTLIQNLAIDMRALKFDSEGDFRHVNRALLTTEAALQKFTSLKKLTLVASASDVQEIARRSIDKLVFQDPSAELDSLEIQEYRENYEGKEDSMQDAIDDMPGKIIKRTLELDDGQKVDCEIKIRCELEVKCLGELGDFARYEDCDQETDMDDN